MKNIRKFILAALFGTAAMNSTAQTVIASGYCGKQVYNLTWTLYGDSTLVINGSGDMEDYYTITHEVVHPWRKLSCYNYTLIRTVIIGDNVTSIGSAAFDMDRRLTSVTIGRSVTTIRFYAFWECRSLTSVIIPNSVTTIEGGAFADCTSLTSVIIGNGVATIEPYAFSNCINLASLTVNTVTPPVFRYSTTVFNGAAVFNNVPDTIPVYVPCKSVPTYQLDTSWNYFSNFIGMGYTDAAFIFDTACAGTTYTKNGFNIPAVAGIYYVTVPSIYRCDSVICLTLAIYPQTPITYYSATICQGEFYTDNNFTNLAYTGIYYDTLQNVNGCDSIIGLTLTVKPIYIVQISDSIHTGNSYNFFDKLLTTDGIYYDTLQAINGCDSIIKLTLTVTGVGISEISYELQVTSYEIYNIVGQLLLSYKSLPPIEQTIKNLPMGIYIVRRQTNQGTIIKKIIKF